MTDSRIASTMPEFPLTLEHIFVHGLDCFGGSTVSTFDGQRSRRRTYAESAGRAGSLARGLSALGVNRGDSVGTFMWNTSEHLEAYFAVPGLGAVLHPINVRLSPEQLAFTMDQAGENVVLVHSSLVGNLEPAMPLLDRERTFIVVRDDDTSDADLSDALGAYLEYEELVEGGSGEIPWPKIDERAPIIMCHTTGTTGDPKAVVYSHRSVFLHTFATNASGIVGLTDRERIMILVPMFHVNAWGYPYAAWLTGASQVLPGRFVRPEVIASLITTERPTISAAVPTVWRDLLEWTAAHRTDLSSLRLVLAGGSAVHRALLEGFDALGVRMLQGWGMTETGPVCGIADPPADADPGAPDWRVKTARIAPGVEARIVAEDGQVLPADGASAGEIQLRGPWVTASYHGIDDQDRFDAGWLRTGDVGTKDDRGFIAITDRTKDVIKSGGEWISSVELENQVMNHPAVLEAAAVASPDERWGERPLVIVALREDTPASEAELRQWLGERVPKWWIPDAWVFVDSLPKTSVGKIDKRQLRARFSASQFAP